jgi:hypothetical protein
VYSNHQKQQKAVQAKLASEKQSESVSEDIANTPAANDGEVVIDVELEGSN